MAIRKITIKRNDNGTVDTLYPTTTVDQIYDSTGLNAFVDGSGKINETFLPTSVFGGMRLVGIIDADTTVSALTTAANTFASSAELPTTVGLYWIVGGVRDPFANITGTYNPSQPYTAGQIVIYNNIVYQANQNTTGNAPTGSPNNNAYWVFLAHYNNFGQDATPRIKITGLSSTEEQAGLITNPGDTSETDVNVEAGDWVIITAHSGSGNHTFRVINNTYEYATTTTAGIMSASDKSKLDGIASNANNYSLPLAADGTRGGIQIGFSSTETNRAVVLSSEKGYVSLPRTIPNISVNGSTVEETQVSIYAPTSVGSSGQIVQSDADGAPNWIDYTAIFYATADSQSDDGTLYFELDS